MIRFFTGHPTAANLLMLILAALGVLAIPSLTRESMPDVTPPEVEVRVIYPGASAAEVEEAVCSRIEDALDSVRNVEEVRSEAKEGVAVVVAEMEEGRDFATFQDDIRSEIDAIDDFPAQVEDPVVTVLGREDLVFSVLVSGPMDATDLKDYCEYLREEIQRVPEVSTVGIKGFADRQLRVSLDADKLRLHGLSVADVRDRIAGQSVDVPAGTLETNQQDLLVRFVEQRRTSAELGSLIIVSEESGRRSSVARTRHDPRRVRDLGVDGAGHRRRARGHARDQEGESGGRDPRRRRGRRDHRARTRPASAVELRDHAQSDHGSARSDLARRDQRLARHGAGVLHHVAVLPDPPRVVGRGRASGFDHGRDVFSSPARDHDQLHVARRVPPGARLAHGRCDRHRGEHRAPPQRGARARWRRRGWASAK